MGYVSRRRAGRAAAKGDVPGLPPARVPRFGAPRPSKPSPELRAPSPDLFSVLPRRPGARAGAAVGAQPQHRVRGAFSGFASIRAGQSRTPRAPARGTLGCARRVEERRPERLSTGGARRRSPRVMRSTGLPQAYGRAVLVNRFVIVRPSTTRSTPPSCSCPRRGCRLSCPGSPGSNRRANRHRGSREVMRH